MDNIEYELVGDNLVITIDLKGEHNPSKSGKSLLFATTKGNKPLSLNGYNLKLGLNLFQPI
jgi:hypothetical protein